MDGLTLELPLFLFATFAGAFVAGLSGFAFGLVSGIDLAVHPDALAERHQSDRVGFGLLVQGLLHLEADAARSIGAGFGRSLAGAALGVPAGVTLLTWLDPRSVRIAVGVFLVIYSVYAFLRPTLKPVTNGGAAADGTVGFLNGVLGGLTGLAGILVTIWCGLRGWPKDVQRSTFQPAAVAIFLMSALWLGAKGTITPDTIKLFVMGLPCVLVGTWLGLKLFGKIDEATFRKIVLALLFLSGVALIL